MLFNSIEFMLFFPAVAVLYFALPYAYRWGLLLVASYVFYMAWNPFYLILILLSTVVDFMAGLKMEGCTTQQQTRRWLYVSLAVNLGLLFSFKYLNFAGEVLRDVLGLTGMAVEIPYSNLLLPVGISFYTFQTLSYTIEVYKGNQKPIHHLGHFALYVSFFPQLVAGPIERPQHLLPQLMQRYDFDYARIVSGLRLIFWGLFKKVVIADRLAVIVNAVYMEPERYPGSILMLATVFFAFQIYCDFSGYTDIAIGSARVFGIDLMKNFNRPYLATSIADFWRRWHISLSTWFRDYVYYSLGGNQGTQRKWVFALLATFLLSGLWHGANWTYVVWGLLHVSYYLAECLLGRNDTQSKRDPVGLLRYGKIALTFTLVCLAWIFFRAETVGDAWFIVTHLPDRFLDFAPNGGFAEIVASWDLSMRAFQLNVLLVIFLFAVEAWIADEPVGEHVGRWPAYVRWPIYVGMGLAIMNLGITDEIPFVYFQF